MALNDDRGQRWAVARVGFHYQIWVVQTWGTRQDCNFHGDDRDGDGDGDDDDDDDDDDDSWLFMVIYGYLWLSMVFNGY